MDFSAAEDIMETVLQKLARIASPQRAEIFACVMVELLNAGGIPMDGETVQSGLQASPPIVNEIAALLDRKATLTRNKYSIYPFARPSICASGPVYFVDAISGELHLLLNRRIKDSYQWLYAAGYMELLPPNVSALQPERVSESERNSEEEGTIGLHFSASDKEKKAYVKAEKMQLPRQRPLRQLIYDEFKILSARERWDSVVSKLADPAYLKDLFKRYAIDWPEHFDISSKNTFVRETFEETGFNLSDYPEAVIQLARSLDASVASGGARLYNVDQLYFGYLGLLDIAPALADATTEAVEAAWIPASDIYRSAERNQYVVRRDNRPLHFNAMQGIEYTLLGLLNYLIEQVSAIAKPGKDTVIPLFSNAAGVQAALIAYSSDHLASVNELIDINISADKTLPSMLDKDGQALFRSFIAAAKALAEKCSPVELDRLIADAKKRPQTLIHLLQGK